MEEEKKTSPAPEAAPAAEPAAPTEKAEPKHAHTAKAEKKGRIWRQSWKRRRKS